MNRRGVLGYLPETIRLCSIADEETQAVRLITMPIAQKAFGLTAPPILCLLVHLCQSFVHGRELSFESLRECLVVAVDKDARYLVPNDDVVYDLLILSTENLAKNCVLPVEPGSWAMGDEELAAVRVRAAIRHGEETGPVEMKIGRELILEGVAGSACPITFGIAPLDHEVGNDPVKCKTIVETLCR